MLSDARQNLFGKNAKKSSFRPRCRLISCKCPTKSNYRKRVIIALNKYC